MLPLDEEDFQDSDTDEGNVTKLMTKYEEYIKITQAKVNCLKALWVLNAAMYRDKNEATNMLLNGSNFT